MKAAIGYTRVSTEEQADSGLGLEAQRDKIRAYCALKGLKLDQVYEDAAVSGGKPLDSRPAGSKLLTAARKGKPVVIVAKLDRLFRSVADAAAVIADFDRKGIELVAIAEGFDMTNPYGRAMAQMAAVFAELERAMIRERTRNALRIKVRNGQRVSSRVPFGFDLGTDAKTLLPNAKEQAAIRLMRKLRQAGQSYRKIAAELNARRIKTKCGKPWLFITIKGILNRALREGSIAS